MEAILDGIATLQEEVEPHQYATPAAEEVMTVLDRWERTLGEDLHPLLQQLCTPQAEASFISFTHRDFAALARMKVPHPS